jgi:hypothetical protein
MLTEVVQINGSLRPAVLHWTSTQETVDSALVGLPDQEILAQKVIERVESQLAELLPELLRQSVDDVIREHLGDNPNSL